MRLTPGFAIGFIYLKTFLILGSRLRPYPYSGWPKQLWMPAYPGLQPACKTGVGYPPLPYRYGDLVHRLPADGAVERSLYLQHRPWRLAESRALGVAPPPLAMGPPWMEPLSAT